MMDPQKIKQQVEASLFNTNQKIVGIDRTYLIEDPPCCMQEQPCRM